MTTDRITNILESVYARLETLLPSERFYVALYDSPRNELIFPFVREKNPLPVKESDWARRLLKSDAVLPDMLITRGGSMLFEKELSSRLESEAITYWQGIPPNSWLGVTMRVGDEILGALVTERASGSFSVNDQRLLITIARQTAIAIENARIYDQLENRIDNLRILNDVGQKLTRGLAKQEDEILSLIYESATNLGIDTHNMYIAFYDPAPDKTDTENEIFGNIRFPLAFDEGKAVFYSARPASNGLTEYVIRTKESFNPPDVKKVYQELAQNQIDKIPLSWLGVPMLSKGRVFGVIVLRHNKHKRAYTDDVKEVLEILAGQAAIALQNLRWYEAYLEELEQRINMERVSAMSTMAAEFAHKMNNVAGTIPVRVSMARELLDLRNSRDEKIDKQLQKIELEAEKLLQAAQEIRSGIKISETGDSAEDVDVNLLIEIATERAKNSRSNLQSKIDVQYSFTDGLPKILIERNTFLDTLTNVIKNAMEAIDDIGKVTIESKLRKLNGNNELEILVIDTGKGIPPSELPKIFDLFYSTKGDKGLGFGLWRDKIFIRKIGGDIDVLSTVKQGSTFIIRIPIEGKNTYEKKYTAN